MSKFLYLAVFFALLLPFLNADDDASKRLADAVQNAMNCHMGAWGKNEIKNLLKSGQDVNTICHHGKTPIEIAIDLNDIEITRELIAKKADLNRINILGFSPLIIAIGALDRKSIELIEVLIDGGADVNYATKYGRTALFTAIASGQSKVTELLIKKNAHVNHVDNEGSTPLLEAVASGDIEIVKLLLEAGANIYHKNNKGKDAFDIARQEGTKSRHKDLSNKIIEALELAKKTQLKINK